MRIKKKKKKKDGPTYFSFKAAVHADDEGIVGERKDVPLQENLLDLVPQHQVLLADLLHGKALSGPLVSHQIHRPATVQMYTQHSFSKQN
jgi:hypothetical protein